MRDSRISQRLSQALLYSTLTAGTFVWICSLPGVLAHTASEKFEIAIICALVIIVGYKSLSVPSPNFKRGQNTDVVTSISDALVIFTALVHGIAAAIFIAGIDGFTSSRNQTRKVRSNLFSLALLALSTGGAMTAYRLAMLSLSGVYQCGLSTPFARMAVPLLVFTLTHFLINTSVLCTVISLRDGESVWKSWRENYLWLVVNTLPAASAAGLMFIGAQKFGWSAFFIGVPIVALVYFSYRQHGKRVEEQLRHSEEINRTHLATIEALATAIDAKDQTTSGHVRRTQLYAVEIGKTIGMKEAEIEAVKAAAVLHDVGKIAIPEYILNKPGRLTDEEFAIMKTHVLVGAEILRGVNFPYPVIPAVKHHHERYDGSGYPDGLKGEEIPITARVLSVVDVYDALMQDRPYRKGLPKTKVIEMMNRDAGSHFDPAIVEIFFANIGRLEEMVRNMEPEEERPSIPIDLTTKYPIRREVEPDKLVYSNQAHHDFSNAYRELLSLRFLLETESFELSHEDAVAVLLSKLPRIIPHDTSVVYIFSPDKGHLCAEFSAGRDSGILRGREIKPNEGVSGWSFVNRKPLHNTNPAFDLEGASAKLASEYRGVASAPMIVGDRVLGVLTIYSRQIDHYIEEHLAIFHKVAACATGIFESRQLRIAAADEVTALVDAETGIANRQALEQYWAREAVLAERSRRPLSLLHLRIKLDDPAQAVQATTLQMIARLLRTELRGSDFVGQASPSSLAAILSGIDLGAAAPVAERIARIINQYRMSEEQGWWDFEISILDGKQIEASGKNLAKVIELDFATQLEGFQHSNTHLTFVPPGTSASHELEVSSG